MTEIHRLQHTEFLGKAALIDWGRHWRMEGSHGPAVVYMGEAAEVMRLVLKHTERKDDR